MHRHTFTSVAAASALAVVISLAPTVSLAAGPSSDSFGGFFSNWFGFGHKVALADTATTPHRNLPPSISGVTAPTVLTADTEGTWTVNASDPENGSLSYSVDWGDRGFMAALFSANEQAFVQSPTFTHTYTSPGTYTVRFTVKDDAGLSAHSSVTVHVVAAPKPLTISNVSANPMNQTHASITWDTNLRSDSMVYYATSTPVDTSTALSAGNRTELTHHRVNLEHLSAGTTYYFIVSSKGADGTSVNSSESSFVTPQPKNGAPDISNVSGPETLTADTEGTWTVNASDPENGSLSYSVDWGDANAFMRMMALVAPQSAFTQTSTFSHTYSAPGTYTITFTAKDDAGLTATSKTQVVVTEAPPAPGPIISDAAVSASTDSATVTWMTDENADSEAWVDTSAPDTSAHPTASDDGMVTAHSLTLTGLSASTDYEMVIGSHDAQGNFATTSLSFTTAANTDTTPPQLSDLTALVGTDSVTFSWKTDENADSEVYYSSTAPVVIDGDTTKAATDGTLSTDHSITVSGLSSGTAYAFLVQSKDASSNANGTTSFSLTTMGF